MLSTAASSDAHKIRTSRFGKRYRVVIVDDEPQVLVALEDVLSDDFVVETTDSPEVALRLACSDEDIAVVVSDQRMPRISGHELLGQVAKKSKAERILVTGYADLSAVIKAVNEGQIFAYLTKPWDPDELRMKVHQAAEHHELLQRLEHERKLLDDLMRNVPDGIYFKDSELRFLKANAPVAELLGQNDPKELVGKRLSELSGRRGLDAVTEVEERRIVNEGLEVIDSIRQVATDQDRRWLSETKVPIRSDGQVIGLVGIARDVSERVKAENVRERQAQRIAGLTRIHKMLSGINGAIVRIRDRDALSERVCQIAVEEGQLPLAAIVTHEEQRGFHANQGAFGSGFAQSKLAIDAIVADSATALSRVLARREAVVAPNPTVMAECAFQPRLKATGLRSIVLFPLFAAGEVQAILMLGSNQADFFDDDELELLRGLADNISFAFDHFEQAARLDFLAYYDELTGLPNRRLLVDRLTQRLVNADDEEQKVAVAVLDVYRFRELNETFGRDGGDHLLRQMATRLERSMGKNDSLARLEGNRFALLVSLDGQAFDIASHVDQLVHKVLDENFVLRGTELRLAARMGIALFPSDGDQAEALLANAEAALKVAKSVGSPYVFYSPRINARVAERVSLETRLRRAVEKEEFLLHYQPKIDLRSGAVAGLEALIRWQTPEDGLVSPGVFIPVLEETGLIMDVGRWVLRRAAQQYVEWVEAGYQPPRIAVNVSALQLSQPDFVATLKALGDAYGPVARQLDLEITESVFVDDLTGNVNKLTEARNMGHQVAIDDFGTGYSSLGYLTRLPIDVLKIDRAFVSRMTQNPEDMSLVSMIISLAHSLDCKVVAEGVERAEEARLLRLLRCDQLQGYLTSKPIPSDAAAATFQERFSTKWEQA